MIGRLIAPNLRRSGRNLGRAGIVPKWYQRRLISPDTLRAAHTNSKRERGLTLTRSVSEGSHKSMRGKGKRGSPSLTLRVGMSRRPLTSSMRETRALGRCQRIPFAKFLATPAGRDGIVCGRGVDFRAMAETHTDGVESRHRNSRCQRLESLTYGPACVSWFPFRPSIHPLTFTRKLIHGDLGTNRSQST